MHDRVRRGRSERCPAGRRPAAARRERMAQLRLRPAGRSVAARAQPGLRPGLPRRRDDVGPAVPRRGDAPGARGVVRGRRRRARGSSACRVDELVGTDEQRAEQLQLAVRIADRFARAVLAAAISRLEVRHRPPAIIGAWRPCARRARATATTPAASLVVIENGRIKHVRGDPAHHVARGQLCRKCSIGYNGAFHDPEMRLRTPLRRVGPKGEGVFEPVSWPDAISARSRLASRRSPRSRPGKRPQRALHRHLRADRRTPSRCASSTGSARPKSSPDTVCNNAGHVALTTSTAQRGRASTPDGARFRAASSCGARTHPQRAARRTATGCRESRGPHHRRRPDPHRDGRAGGDPPPAAPGQRRGARLRAAHVIRRDGLVDEAFLEVHAARLRRARAAARRLHARVERERSPACRRSLIEQSRAPTLRGPSLLWMGQGLQRQPRGGNVMRACSILPALTGQPPQTRTGFLYLNGGDSRGIDFDGLAGAELAATIAPAPISQMDLAARPRPTPSAQRALVVLEHQPRRVESRAGGLRRRSPATTCCTVVMRPLPDRHGSLRGRRAARGELPRVRRHRRVVLPPHAVGPGEGRGAARRGAAQRRRSSAGSPPTWASTSRAAGGRRR